MLYENQTRDDGYVKVSEGAAYIQLQTTSEFLGVIHKATPPDSGDAPEFTITQAGVKELMAGTTPCYVKVITGGSATFGAVDIS
jgi:hypothetical protein